MGTSTSNPGPVGRPPLLPPWAEPPEPDPAPPAPAEPPDMPPAEGAPLDGPQNVSPVGHALPLPPDQRPSWNSPRRLIGAVASGRSGDRARENTRRAIQGSVRAMGGGKAAMRGSPAGRRTAGRFAGFLAAVAAGGVAEAARTLGIAEFLGRSADAFLVQLADALAPAGALTEDVIARQAMDATLLELDEELGIADGGIEVLARMTAPAMADAVLRYVVNYIYERVLHALTAHIHATARSTAGIGEIERAARRYIEDAVRVDIDTAAFFGPDGAAIAARWDAVEGQRTINRLFEESYNVVQARLDSADGSTR
jgi:hypothetical protein